MTAAFLLDTNIISALMRDPTGRVRQRVEAIGESAVMTSIIVAAELRFGATKSGSTRLARAVEEILQHLLLLAFEKPDDAEYADIRTHLERTGTPVGPNDMLIGAQARRRSLTVVTANIREFRRIPGLKVENWLD